MTIAAQQIAIEQIGLAGVLNRYHLFVPPNQREYSWREEHIKTLFEDLAKAINDDAPSYFLGAVVTVQREAGELEVVDGQQRLATTAILLSAIRDVLQKDEPGAAASIETEFLTVYDRSKRDTIPRLRLNLLDNDFFKARLTRAPDVPRASRPSNERVDAAFELARDRVTKILGGFGGRDHLDVLNKWVDFLSRRALVVLLRVSSENDAFKMFETLNDRGLKTSAADLIKNYLFSRAASRSTEVHQKWAFMRGALDTLEAEDITITFLRHAVIVLSGYVREQELFDRVQRLAKSEQSVVTLATKLDTMANTYAAIHNADHEKWNGYPDSARRAIATLNFLDVRPLRPLVLGVANKYSPTEAAKTFSTLVSWCVRLMIAGNTRSGSVEQPLAAAAYDVDVGKLSTAADLRKAFKTTIPSDDQFRSAFETANVAKASLARYYLRSLEMAAKGESAPWLIPNDDRQVINLEHVLPKSRMGGWGHFDEESAHVYGNRLGNLALLQAKANSDLRSDEFAAKRLVYGSSPYVLTKMIAEADEWTTETITQRQTVLAGWALKAWALKPKGA